MTKSRGHGGAQLVERRATGSNPVRSTITKIKKDIFLVKNIVLTRCRCAQPPVHLKDPVVYVMSDFGGLRKHEKTQHALACRTG